MPHHPPIEPGQVLRHFTVAVFVVRSSEVLLHAHARLHRWLPPGGHVEENELPDDAAVREVMEETGVRVRLVGGRGLPLPAPRQLVVPVGIQVEPIYPGHEHIDLVYFAVPDPDVPHSDAIDPALAARDRVGWYRLEVLEAMGVDAEIRAWSTRAVAEISRALGSSGSSPW